MITLRRHRNINAEEGRNNRYAPLPRVPVWLLPSGNPGLPSRTPAECRYWKARLLRATFSSIATSLTNQVQCAETSSHINLRG
jgi:hypothetical protein